jgi:hypothetical protein
MSTAISVPHLIRTLCKTCNHSYDPRELLAGLCSYCLQVRLKALDNENLNRACEKAICQNCNAPVIARAYAHWDTLANDFAYLCIPCADEAIQKARQYRGTIFGHIKKVQ